MTTLALINQLEADSRLQASRLPGATSGQREGNVSRESDTDIG